MACGAGRVVDSNGMVGNVVVPAELRVSPCEVSIPRSSIESINPGGREAEPLHHGSGPGEDGRTWVDGLHGRASVVGPRGPDGAAPPSPVIKGPCWVGAPVGGSAPEGRPRIRGIRCCCFFFGSVGRILGTCDPRALPSIVTDSLVSITCGGGLGANLTRFSFRDGVASGRGAGTSSSDKRSK